MTRIALGQIDVTVGDLDGNVALMTSRAAAATELGAQLVAFPELAVTGYPPEDLVLRPAFVEDNLEALAALARATAGGCAVIAGFVDRSDRGLHNACAFLRGGEVVARYHKVHLPNYGVFDEARTFVPGDAPCSVPVGSSPVGLSICEDAWFPGQPWTGYAAERVPLIVNINGSPYHRGKAGERLEVCRARALETGAWIAYVNTVGGQDELVFDGGSMVVAPDGTLTHRAAMFEEDLLVVDIPDAIPGSEGPSGATWPSDPEDVYRALVLGLRDYVRKNGFRRVVIGLSGGIDSALVAALAADAVGPRAVRTVAMPSMFSSPESLRDAEEVAHRLGTDFTEVPIAHVLEAYEHALAGVFASTQPDVTGENLQARIRGNYLMAMSNKFGSLVLATGNKSEYAVGYATLYGDMAGGFAPIKDVPKTLVYELCRWRNAAASAPRGLAETGSVAPIPQAVLDKAPSAELRPDQKDTDSLPPYEELDPVIHAYVEEDRSPEDMIAAGMDAATVRRVVRMIDRAEYKRRQAAPGIKITPKAFGRDRRIPITNAYGRSPDRR